MKIFLSYSRRDDKEPLNKVSNLRKAFEIVLSQVAGKDCEIYIDRLSLRWGSKWKEEITRLIDKSDYFVAIVTPSFFNSRMCAYELQTANSKKKIILPVYFRTCSELKSKFKEGGLDKEVNKSLNKASLIISATQMKDFRDLRNESLNSNKVEDFLDEMAYEII